MEEKENGSLDTLVEEKISNDTEFQASLVDMSDDEKADAVATKTTEVRNAEFAELSTKNKNNEEIAKNQKIRAEKAEGKNGKPAVGEDGKPLPAEKDEDALSTSDLYALMTAEVPQEDVVEVQKAAKLLGKTIQEALQDEMVKGILVRNAEHRKTAEAANTDDGKPGVTQKTDEQVLKEASEGNIPDPGTPEATQLYNARRGIKNK